MATIARQTPGLAGPRRADAIAAALFFAVALALRLAYLGEIRSLPSVEVPMVDAASYHEWGRRIASGDWMGDRVFYQAPAYPYFLGLVYTLFGDGSLVPRLAQALLGAASCVLIFASTRRLFGRAAGVAAGAFLALYAPAIFFDGLIQKTSLGLFLTTGLIWLLTGFDRRPDPLRAAAIGAVCALLALTRENALLLAVAIPPWLFVHGRREGAAPATCAGVVLAFGLGLALLLVPVGLRNLAVGGHFALTTAQLGPNLYIGNNEEATGIYAPLLPGRQTPDFEGRDARRAAEWRLGRELDAGEVSAYWRDESLAWIRSDPGAAGRLLLAKLFHTINDYEIPDTEDPYVHAEFSRVLSALQPIFRFGVLFPLACAGMVLAWRGREGSGLPALLAALAGLFALGVAAFYVWARYRFPLVPLLLPFAGLALARGAALVFSKDWRALVAPGAAGLVATWATSLPHFDRERMTQAAWLNLGNAMIQQRRYAEADPYLERALRIDHASADLHFQRAVARQGQGRGLEAEAELRRMLEIDARDHRGHRMLARLLKERGANEEAAQHLREAIRLDPARKRKGRPGSPIPRPSR